MKNSDTVLVTGGTGFVGSHCILKLLQEGYTVKTTLRSMKRKDEVLTTMKEGDIDASGRLQFIEADLLRDDNWDEAVKGCTYVLHVASPIFSKMPDDDNEVIRPAVEGTLRVLKAARNGGVKRVVLTSNFGAIGYSHKDPDVEITEEEWTNPHEKGMSSYSRSKVLAERAAWDFINAEGNGLQLSVINPVFILGPSLGADNPSGFDLLNMLLSGGLKAVPNIPFNIIDVRDVADLHFRAMITPQAGGERFIALAGGKITMPQIALLLKEKMPGAAKKVSRKKVPNWVIYVSSLFNKQAKEVAHLLKVNRKVNSNKAKRVLSWAPMATNEDAIIASVKSMIKFGTIKQ